MERRRIESSELREAIFETLPQYTRVNLMLTESRNGYAEYSRQELEEFLRRDMTDREEYGRDYDCDDFVISVLGKAKIAMRGIAMGFVDLYKLAKWNQRWYAHCMLIFYDGEEKEIVIIEAMDDTLMPYNRETMSAMVIRI